jgi:hypothetical protein
MGTIMATAMGTVTAMTMTIDALLRCFYSQA